MNQPEATNDYWSQRRVLVTGGAGFLGSHVLERLRKAGAREIFVPRKRDYDLTHREDVRRLLADSNPDFVLHLAATAGGIGANQARPEDFFFENLQMGTLLMHEVWKHDVPKMVSMGTVCSYPKFTPAPFSEANLWDGYPEETNAPYGLAKKMLIVQSKAYREQYGFNSVNLIPVNLYGARDNFDLETSHVIPALIRKLLEAKERRSESAGFWGDGSPTREFLYASDAAEGILLAAQYVDLSDPINHGQSPEISMRYLTELLAKLTGFEGRFKWDTSKPNGQPRRVLDTSKAKSLFGFVARTTLEEGLTATIQWYRDHRAEAVTDR